ncbi:MAG: GAF domain-containing protein [Solirubrobacterales bacterium]|nr:GAF domain-containing protein [Solirubrobacterales bacterium]
MLKTAPEGVVPPPASPLPRRDAARHREAIEAIEVLERAGALLGWDAWQGPREFLTHQGALDALEFARETLAARLREVADGPGPGFLRETSLLLLELEDARRALGDEVLHERHAALVGVQSGLGRLRGIGSASAMLDKATEEVCRGCGFDRSILFRVHDSRMIAVSVYYEGDPEGAARLLEIGTQMPADLDHLLLETEMIRRRIPMLVPDPQHDPRVHKAVAVACGTTSYVAAPIMPKGQVIGFLHADRHYQRREVDEFDREMLWAFAEGFGYAFEGTVLLERLHVQREQVRRVIASTNTLMDELCNTESDISRLDESDSNVLSDAAAMLTGASPQLGQMLTRRELEVIGLMATGETNVGIANRLVISEGTVKSHVKHILRKLRAANRAEAVSRYMRITALDDDT